MLIIGNHSGQDGSPLPASLRRGHGGWGRLKYFAISTTFPPNATLFGWKTQVMLAAIGYAVFGVGAEVAGITVSKAIVRWFKGKEMALAMGMQLATARIGTALAMMVSAPIAAAFKNVSAPILMALIMLCIGLICFIVYSFMDKKLEVSEAGLAGEEEKKEDSFRISDIKLILKNLGFWYIAMLCVLFYSAVFPS